MTEPTVPVPVSLIERSATAAHEAGWDYTSRELKALLSQSIPPAEPHCIEDMAPGTTLIAQKWGVSQRIRVTVGAHGRHLVHSMDGGGWVSAQDVDPSTIRDVTPPTDGATNAPI